ncbi:hypothetical protein P154DRAFT_226552 [Amniculicola lignicola CBS 123094]|uniref:BZIP domain-containing protein n=1 Tax=Amniculicola lignicola CBS 123094 TaxID=1392246 RepID=A0A6A5WK28_9PLEO|nr:hypothetical protein P154DRAFT_226552 [Amniculicola lignicola CBS 123094]
MEYHRPSSTLSFVDRKPSTFSFDDAQTLDSSILDTPVLMSPTTSTQGIFSPDTSQWEDFSAGQFVDRTASSSVVNHNGTNPFFTEQSNNPFARLPANQAATYGQQTSWPVHDNSGSRTPTAPKPLNPFGPGEYDSGSSNFTAAPSHMAFHGLPLHSNNVRPSAVFPQAAPEQPLSPHTNSEWMAFNQQEMDSRPGPKRMRPHSPTRSYSPRRDGGIRKKNARFDIPAERNLTNIDQLIANCGNDDEMKELKQQKRLLRNRQAALDSRQRKKRHTEELEEEKKVWHDKMVQLEDDVGSLTIERNQLLQQREQWHQEHMEMTQMLQQMQYEKEELVRTHTLETGELRKKVSVLSEKLDNASTAMTVQPSSTFTDFTSDMDGLNMGANEWDNYIFVNDFVVDEPTPAPQQDQSMVVAPRSKDAEDKPVASGLLLMLLLCGAFVASKSSGSSAPPIPRMPDDIRAASATVLDSIFKDAGVVPTLTEQGVVANRVSDLEPGPSGASWPKPSDLTATSGSTLDQLHAQLAVPTKDQENEQLFSITPAQYNSMTSMDFTRPRYSIASDDLSDPLSPGSQPSHHRRNLAETLAAMREQSKGETAADIYTRSLLWDRIAPEVVHEFKRMVEQSAASSRPSTSDGMQHMESV